MFDPAANLTQEELDAKIKRYEDAIRAEWIEGDEFPGVFHGALIVTAFEHVCAERKLKRVVVRDFMTTVVARPAIRIAKQYGPMQATLAIGEVAENAVEMMVKGSQITP